MSEVTCAVDAGNLLGEGPLWDVGEQALYWVDVLGKAVQRWHPASGEIRHWPMPDFVGCLAVRAGPGLLVGLADGFYFFDPDRHTLERISNPERDRPDNRINDGKGDRQGRFWAGTMKNNYAADGSRIPVDVRQGAVYRLGADRRSRRMADGYGITNTFAWSPDDRTFYVGCSLRKEIEAWDFDAETGDIANRRVFVSGGEGRNDGSTIDEEGCLWTCRIGAGKIVRYDPDGRAEREIALPVSRPTSCMFGGPDLDVLYVTTAVDGLSEEERAAQPWAGHLLAVEPGVRGLPEARYKA
jgi:sugar lactone lactonase YvrE